MVLTHELHASSIFCWCRSADRTLCGTLQSWSSWRLRTVYVSCLIELTCWSCMQAPAPMFLHRNTPVHAVALQTQIALTTEELSGTNCRTSTNNVAVSATACPEVINSQLVVLEVHEDMTCHKLCCLMADLILHPTCKQCKLLRSYWSSSLSAIAKKPTPSQPWLAMQMRSMDRWQWMEKKNRLKPVLKLKKTVLTAGVRSIISKWGKSIQHWRNEWITHISCPAPAGGIAQGARMGPSVFEEIDMEFADNNDLFEGMRLHVLRACLN